MPPPYNLMIASTNEPLRARRKLASDVDALDLKPLQVAAVLRNLQAAAVPERGISVTLEVDESLHILADEELLMSAVGQLLDNALRCSCWGAHVIVRCRAEELGVSIEVEDECGGLPDRDPLQLLARAIEPADHPHGHSDSGLATSKRAVEAMGGEVYVENYPGRGCTFALLFPPARPSRITSIPPANNARR
jgi:signal transduction histidine kinase